MAFPIQTPQPLMREAVLTLQPNLRGCYGLVNSIGVVYVGSSRDIRKRLLEHLRRDNPSIWMFGPTHFVVGLTPDEIKEEARLIHELNPVANIQNPWQTARAW